MSTTTQEDYFGNPVDDQEPSRHRKHRHRKHHSQPSESEPEDVSSREVAPDDREHKRSSRRHKSREAAEPVYENSDTDGASTDDGERRRRRRRHRRHRQDAIPDTAGTVSEPESGTDVDDRSTNTSSGMRSRAKNMGESAIAALGLEDTYKRARSKSRGRKSSYDSDEGYDSHSGRARSRSRMNSDAAQAAILAAAVEAFRSRKEPGGVTGSKGLKRIVEAAVASGAVEKFLDRKGENDGKSTRRVAEAVLAGLATERGINGKRRKGRHGDESNPLKDLVASGLIASVGKKALDYKRSRSESRSRGGPESGERAGRPDLDRRRSRSVGEALAALGLGGLAAERFTKGHRSSGNSRSRNSRSRNSRRPGILDDSSSDSSISDSDLELDEESERKRHQLLRRKEIIGVALAILATLHLGHTAYEAKEKRAARREKLEDGKITEEESDKLKHKALFGDAAAVGLAVLAATEAVKSWKDLNKRRKEYREFDKKHEIIEEHRRQKMLEQGGGSTAAARRGSDASKYYSQPGYMGPPPGARDAPAAYPYYPSSGPIPVPRDTYGSKNTYGTRDGREIPVVYPSSVTHA